MSSRGRSLIAAALVAVLVAACGQARTERSNVNAYIRHVQTVEQAMSPLLKETTKAISQFATEQHRRVSLIGNLSLVTIRQDLRGTRAHLIDLRQRLAGLSTPAAAGHLRGLVLELTDAQISLAGQVSQLVGFLPPFSADLEQVPAAIRRLQGVLARAGSYAPASAATLTFAKAAALERFSAQMRGLVRRLSRLHPPPVSLPGYRAEVRSVKSMGTAAARLAAALRAGDASQVPLALEAFDRAATLSRTPAAQRAQVAAIRAYDRRVAQLNQLVTAIDQERSRLDQMLA